LTSSTQRRGARDTPAIARILTRPELALLAAAGAAWVALVSTDVIADAAGVYVG